MLLSRTPQDSIDTIAFKTFISSSVYVRTAKTGCSKKDILHSTPLYKTFILVHTQ